MTKISYFNAPVTNILPSKELSILEVLKLIKGDQLKTLTEQIRKNDSKGAIDEFKRNNLPGVTFSGTFKSRRDNELIKNSGLVCVDLDGLPEAKLQTLVNSSLASLPTKPVGYFVSPSGKGIKIIFRVDTSFTPKQNYEAAANYLKDKLELGGKEIDPSGSNLSRLCFLCHDPKCFINPNVLGDNLDLIPMVTPSQTESSDHIEQEIIRSEDHQNLILENQYLDSLSFNYQVINSTNNLNKLFKLSIKKSGEYKPRNRHNFILGFASLSNKFGITKDYLKEYTQTTLKDHPNTVLLSDPFSYEGELLPLIDDVYTRYVSHWGTWTQEEEEECDSPFIPPSVYEHMPIFLKKACTQFKNPREKDVFLLGSLGVLSNCFPIVQGIYDDKPISASLFILISAPASAGKGALHWSRKYIKEINGRLQDKFSSELQAYEAELNSWTKESDGPKPQKPPRPMFVIPANISSSGIVAAMSNNKTFGLMFETEADTLTHILKNEWANFSDVLRKAFHHEPVYQYRKQNDELIQIERSFLSMVLSGTPQQLKTLLGSIENGFFSRLLFYDFKQSIEWKNVFEKKENDLESFFNDQSDILSNILTPVFDIANQQEMKITFQLTENQEDAFNKWFSEKQEKLNFIYGEDIVPSIRRLGVIFFRITMIFSILRKLDELGARRTEFYNERRIICNDVDFNLTNNLIDCLLLHTLAIYRKVKNHKKNKYGTSNKEIYFKALPPSFDFQGSQEAGRMLGLPNKTSEKWLYDFVKEERVERLHKGNYAKIKGGN